MTKPRKEQLDTFGGNVGDTIEIGSEGTFQFSPNTGSGAASSLSEVLGISNVTDGYDIDFNNGSKLVGSDGYIQLNILTGAGQKSISFKQDDSTFAKLNTEDGNQVGLGAVLTLEFNPSAAGYSHVSIKPEPTDSPSAIMLLSGQDATGVGNDGGQTIIIGGGGNDTGEGGTTTIYGGFGGSSGSGGALIVSGGLHSGGAGDAAQISLGGGNTSATSVSIIGISRRGSATDGNGGRITWHSANGDGSGIGGAFVAVAGDGGSTGNGGSAIITSGAGGTGATDGYIALNLRRNVADIATSATIQLMENSTFFARFDPNNTDFGGQNVLEFESGAGGRTTVRVVPGSGSQSAKAMFVSGPDSTDNSAGNVIITGGEALGASGNGGRATVEGGRSGDAGNGGDVQINSQDGGSTSGDGGPINITAGSAGIGGDGNGGFIAISSGRARGTNKNGGDITLDAQQGIGSGNDGSILLNLVTGASNNGTIEFHQDDGYFAIFNPGAVAQFSDPVQVPSFTVSGVPSASVPGRIIYVSDETGGAVLAFSDGTNWLRVTDRIMIS